MLRASAESAAEQVGYGGSHVHVPLSEVLDKADEAKDFEIL